MTCIDQALVNSAGTVRGTSALLGRRRRAAGTALIAHLAGVIVPGVLMAATEGPAAPASLGQSVTLARVQLVLLAVTWLVQAALLGNWTRLALTLRRARWGRDASPSQVVVHTAMASVIAACWLAEIGYLPLAAYQAGSGGIGDQNAGFTIAMIVIFAAAALGGGLTAVTAKLTERSRAATPRLSPR